MFELAALLLAKSYLDRFDKNDSVQVSQVNPYETYRDPFSKKSFGVLFVVSLIISALSFWISGKVEDHLFYNLIALGIGGITAFTAPFFLFFFLKCVVIQSFKL